MCLQNNKAYAQDGGDDKTKSIILNKYLTPTEDPSKFKITLSSFVYTNEEATDQYLNVALVLDHSSSMCASDGVWTEVATGASLDNLCLDMNYAKNGGSKDKHPDPFFNQQRQITISGNTYPLMYYQRKITLDDTANLQKKATSGDSDKTKENKANDNAAFIKRIEGYLKYTKDKKGTITGISNFVDRDGKDLVVGEWYYFVEEIGWTKYTSKSANDKVESQIRIDILRAASIQFIETLTASAPSWLHSKITVSKFGMNVLQKSFSEVTAENKNNVIDYILNEKFVDASTARTGIIIEGTHYSKVFGEVVKTFGTSSDTQKNVIVFFSDGCPYDGADAKSSRQANADAAIKTIHDSFKTNGTNSFVYTVGLLKGGADNWTQIECENLLRALSSDYPNATKRFDPDSIEPSPKIDKYYSFANPDKLKEIFEDIAHSATADMYPLTDTNSSAVDIMSNSFSLPEGFTAKDVTVHTETCLRIADGHAGDFIDPTNKDISDESFTWTKDQISGQYYEPVNNPPTITVDKENQKIVVSNFNYTLKDNTAPAIGLRGNWVGGRLKKEGEGYDYAGKRLVVEFTVNYNGEPGFNIPSNDTRCGIYPNTTGTGDPIKEYNRPMADFPALIIVKEGLKAGESSIFKVSAGDKVICSLVLTGTGEVYKAGDMAVNKGFYNAGDAVPAIGIVRDLDYGDYTVEELPWSWAYNMTSYHTGGTTVTQTLKKEGIPTEEQAVAAWTAASASGKFIGTAYYVINDGITLAYRFKNTPKTSQPLHGESDALNEMPVGDEGGTGDEEEI